MGKKDTTAALTWFIILVHFTYLEFNTSTTITQLSAHQ